MVSGRRCDGVRLAVRDQVGTWGARGLGLRPPLLLLAGLDTLGLGDGQEFVIAKGPMAGHAGALAGDEDAAELIGLGGKPILG